MKSKLSLGRGSGWWLAGLGALICLIALGTLIIKYSEINRTKEQLRGQNQELMVEVKKLKRENLNKEEEIQIILGDMAKLVGHEYQKPYDFQQFGVDSPLLTGRFYDETILSYRRKIIVRRQIDLEDGVRLVVWEYLKTEKGDAVDPNWKMVIFEGNMPGWSNQISSPIAVTEAWQNGKGAYTPQNDWPMKWELSDGYGGYDELMLISQGIAPNGNRTFLELVKEVPTYAYRGVDDPKLLNYRQELMTIADSFGEGAGRQN